MIRVPKLRRLYEAALKDRAPERFFDEFDEALRTRQLRLDEFSIRQLFEHL